MSDPQIREYRLAKERPDGVSPFLSDAGAFLGDGTPLLERIGSQWRPRSRADLVSRADSLATIAKALNRGDRSLAAIALVQAEFPPLSKSNPDVDTEPRDERGRWTGQSPAAMAISDAGKKFVHQHEGKEPIMYVGADTKNRTIGYGRKLTPQSFFPDGISQNDADTMFMDDIADAERAVRNGVKVPLSQPQYDALVSLAYNIGSGHFHDSQLLSDLNAGNYAGAANRFTDWSHSEGKWVQGLYNRRKDEQALFNSGK